jgi:hypothetical protein
MRGNHSCFSNCVYVDCAQGVAEMPRLALRSGMNKAINDDPRSSHDPSPTSSAVSRYRGTGQVV